ncbi:hypothetical protein AAVH_26461 [Aphelenchoides avenae]|nr:hypothetical protein AAVH_26461 [Aphelenchus avenae]
MMATFSGHALKAASAAQGGRTDAEARKSSDSSDATASDLREMYDESNLKLLKIAFGISWCINCILCALVVCVIVAACFAPVQPSVNTLSALCIFVALFILLTAMLALYMVSKSLVCVTMATVFALEQFLCVAFIAFALFTNERSVPEVTFGDDPLTWMQGHASVAVAFGLVFLPIFIVQLILLTKYAHERSTYYEQHGKLQTPSKIAMFAAFPGF